MAIFSILLPRSVFRTQPKVCGGALTFFAKKPDHKCSVCSKNASVACKEKRNKLSYMILHNFI